MGMNPAFFKEGFVFRGDSKVEKNMNQRSSKSAFTLVEAVISAVILALAIAGSYSLITRSASMIRSSRNHYVAVTLAKDHIERARSIPFSQLHLMAESRLLVDDSGTPDSQGDFRRTTSVVTNYQPGVTLICVTNEIKSLRTRTFQGEWETVAALFTEYLTQ
jgi:Tfp pilus assembly protein PilV